MARFLSLILLAVAAVASWSVGLSFVSGSQWNHRVQRATTTPMHARGGAGAESMTLPLPEDAADTYVAPVPAEPLTLRKRVELAKKRAATGGQATTFGPFSPFVQIAKFVVGEGNVNNVRIAGIKAHTAAIAAFIDHHLISDSGDGYTQFGNLAMCTMFDLADADGSGKVDIEELRTAAKRVGFKWLDDDEMILKAMDRMDTDGNQEIDLEEFMSMAPTVLRQNLAKLAKRNGNALGFLV